MDREAFQMRLAALNPAWEAFLGEVLASGALETEDPEERRRLGLRMNPDGDADVPGAPYGLFRYPACPVCVERPPVLAGGRKGVVSVDADGAWREELGSDGGGGGHVGVLKPNVVMFGESIPAHVKTEAEMAVDSAAKLLVVGSSLATYSAWRLAKRAQERGMGFGILNIGGVRKEEVFFEGGVGSTTTNADAHKVASVRVSLPVEELLPKVVEAIKASRGAVRG
jgi:NAD-dependent SIR2 family protein deacetylase